MVVCDTGPIVALSNHRDEHHYAANNLFRDLHMAGETLLLPPTVLAEVCYWLNEHGGADLEAVFLDSVVDGTFQLVNLTSEDVERMAELVRQFASFPLGGTDASVVAIAERLGAREIATLDRRHLPSLTPKVGGHFTFLRGQAGRRLGGRDRPRPLRRRCGRRRWLIPGGPTAG